MERLTVPDERIEGGERRAAVNVREVKKRALTLYWKLKKYEDTGLTPGQIDNMKEKQRPKKPIRIGHCNCPNCNTYNEVIEKRRNTVDSDIVYCWHCGQAMEINRLEEKE